MQNSSEIQKQNVHLKIVESQNSHTGMRKLNSTQHNTSIVVKKTMFLRFLTVTLIALFIVKTAKGNTAKLTSILNFYVE